VTVLGIDLGRRRIGLAISDPDERVALPSSALASRGLEPDVAAVCAFARERAVDRMVVGLPIHMDGREGPEAAAARVFARRLAEASGLPVDTLDERWTSREAERALAESGSPRRRRAALRRSGALDAAAAAILLRAWLERERSRREAGGA
jgi:putative Holliday junction resolvase